MAVHGDSVATLWVAGSGQVAVRAWDVASVEVSRRELPGPWREGAFIGGLVGAVSGGVVVALKLGGIADCSEGEEDECHGMGSIFTVAGALSGALVGGLIGAALGTSTWEPVGVLPAGSAFTVAPAGVGRFELRGSLPLGGR